MNKKYIVVLTSEERRVLRALISSGEAPARRLTRARILLKADRNDSSNVQTEWSDQAISQALDVSVPTIVRVRSSFVKGGLESALNLGKARSHRKRKFDERQEARLIRLAENKPLRGHRRWTLRSLANKMVQLRYVDSVSHETIRQVLKKRSQPLSKSPTASPARDERRVRPRKLQRPGELNRAQLLSATDAMLERKRQTVHKQRPAAAFDLDPSARTERDRPPRGVQSINFEASAGGERPDTIAESRSKERRKKERRRSGRYATDALVVISGIAFIDEKNSGRRQKIRRQKDRKQLAKLLKTFT